MDMWQYFDPEKAENLTPPEEPKITMFKESAHTLSDLTQTERTVWSQLRTVYHHELSQYQRYITERTKLHKAILDTVPEAYLPKPGNDDDDDPRWLLKQIKASMQPSDSHMSNLVFTRYRNMMAGKFTDWPIGGPDKWLVTWQQLMADCEQWCPQAKQMWHRDLNLVWGEAPGAHDICHDLISAERANTLSQWDVFKVSQALREAWGDRNIRNGMKDVSKTRTTRSVFNTEPTFDGETPEPQTQDKSKGKKRSNTTKNQRSSNKRKQYDPCWGCDDKGHLPHNCLLIRGVSNHRVRISEDRKKVFENRMNDSSFADQVKKVRESAKDLEEAAKLV
jgi:hypothetical protein